MLNTSETIEFSGMNTIINNVPLDELNQIDDVRNDDQNETRASRRIHNFSLNEWFNNQNETYFKTIKSTPAMLTAIFTWFHSVNLLKDRRLW